MRILIVEDHIQLSQALKHHFKDQGHAPTVVHDGETGLQFLKQEEFDLCILDVNLPSLSGLNVLIRSRQINVTTPIIILTARDGVHQRIEGLDAGADDYLVKPFEIDELDARVRAILRRKPDNQSSNGEVGQLTIDYKYRQVSCGGENIRLTKKEVAAFECLTASYGRVVSKSGLINYVYGIGEDVNETTLEVLLSRLRKKIAPYGVQINVLRGLGYFMKADP